MLQREFRFVSWNGCTANSCTAVGALDWIIRVMGITRAPLMEPSLMCYWEEVETLADKA